MPAGCEIDPSNKPVLAIDLPGDRLDLGAVKQGALIERKIPIRNTGTGVLCVKDYHAGCGCVTRILSANALKPGATAKLTIEVNTLTQPDGPNRWQAVVNYATDREEGQIGLTITANLSRESDPSRVKWHSWIDAKVLGNPVAGGMGRASGVFRPKDD